jgi:hypothetical protein
MTKKVIIFLPKNICSFCSVAGQGIDSIKRIIHKIGKRLKGYMQ